MLRQRRYWRFVAAYRLRLMGRDDSARVLYGIDRPKHQHDERLAHEWR